MAATTDQEIDSLLSSFEQIYQDFKSGITEIQLLRSNLNVEIMKREAVETASNILKQENERLKNLYAESLNNLLRQLECRTKCQSLEDELKRVRDEHLSKEDDGRKDTEFLEAEYMKKIGELEAQIRGLLLEKATNETTVNHLRQELAAHKIHMQTLAGRLDQVNFELESKYSLEIQDLKDCLLVEQEEKKDLIKKLQDLEKELVINKTKLVEQQQDLASHQLVEALKMKIMKLRRDNEILRRKLSHLQED